MSELEMEEELKSKVLQVQQDLCAKQLLCIKTTCTLLREALCLHDGTTYRLQNQALDTKAHMHHNAELLVLSSAVEQATTEL